MMAASSPPTDRARLTDAETDIVRLLAAGQTTRQTAVARKTEINTVRAQLGTLYLKLGITHRAQLVLWAIRQGFGGAK